MRSTLKRRVSVTATCFLAVWFTVLWSFGAQAEKPEVSLSAQERQWLSEHRTLRLGVGVAFPPYMWVERKDGGYAFKGMVSDYVDLLGKRLDVDMQIVFGIPFNQALERGRNGRIDLFPCLSKTPERARFLLFTKPYLSYPLVIITREDAPIIGSVEDLEGKRLAVVKHLFAYSKMKNDYPTLRIKYVFTRKVEENLVAVSMGRADACIINLAAASYYIQKNGLTNLKIAAPVNWDSVHLAMGVRKDWPMLLNIIEKALASISQEEKDRISERWIRAEYEPGIPIVQICRWSLGIGLFVAFLFAMFFFWNRRLQKEIFQKEEAEEALKESERKVTTLIGNLPGIAYRCLSDKDWTMLYISDGCKVLTGYEPHEMIENRVMSFKDLIVPEDRPHVWKAVDKALKKNHSFTLEYRIKDKTGNEKWLWEKGRPVGESEGNICILEGFITDITERRRAQLAMLLQKEKAERYLNLAGVMFIGLDDRGNVNVANRKACEILACNEKEIIGQNWFDHFVPPDIRTDVKTVFEELMKGNVEPVEYFENPIISKSGKEKHIAWHNIYMTDDAGNIVGVLSSGEDITEKRRLETQLRHAQKIEAVGTLAGGIAHDFNNILGIILGNAELAADDVAKWSPTRKNLDEIKKACLRAKDVVRQILNFSRKTEIEQKPFDLAAAVSESLKLLRASIPTSIHIRQNIPDRLMEILGDATQIHQIMINLCTNAAHAMENEGGILSVTLKHIEIDGDTALHHPELDPGPHVQLSVTDTGAGISPEVINRIFDPYFTTKEVGEGTGLGLSVVHGIVRSHHGEILVESLRGKGTTFNIFFPTLESWDVEEKKEVSELPGGKESILFVDDEPLLVELNRQRLEKLGYTVTGMTDPSEALAFLKVHSHEIDLIITDMTMPGMTGDKLAERIFEIRPNMPVILCTGYSQKMTDAKARNLDIRKYIEKPIEMAELAGAVRDALKLL